MIDVVFVFTVMFTTPIAQYGRYYVPHNMCHILRGLLSSDIVKRKKSTAHSAARQQAAGRWDNWDHASGKNNIQRSDLVVTPNL